MWGSWKKTVQHRSGLERLLSEGCYESVILGLFSHHHCHKRAWYYNHLPYHQPRHTKKNQPWGFSDAFLTSTSIMVLLNCVFSGLPMAHNHLEEFFCFVLSDTVYVLQHVHFLMPLNLFSHRPPNSVILTSLIMGYHFLHFSFSRCYPISKFSLSQNPCYRC